MSTRKRRQRKIELYLVNDDHNSFLDVIDALSSTLPECSTIRAEQIAMITHSKGVCQIYSGPSRNGILLQTMLITKGLRIVTKLL